MKNAELSITPLGGVGEIGSNMTLLETLDTQVVIDCGILFPSEDVFEINYLIPDFSIIDKKKIKALVITHGHEDHIGAIPHFVEAFPEVPIYCTKFTSLLIRKKMDQISKPLHLFIYEESSILSFNQIEMHPIHVTHSIPETMGILIKMPNWSVLYISDFKVDMTPSFEKAFNLEKIQKLFNDNTKKLSLLDSTNILNNERTIREDDLGPDLENIISMPNRRIFMTLFASNIHRLDRIIKYAKKNNRKIFVLGRSMDAYIKAGIEAGIMEAIASDIHQASEQIKDTSQLLVLVSGCQGDFLSALRRLASNEDSNFKLNDQDIMVFSSKVIPGNEKKLARIFNQITETGATLFTSYDKHIHASGHPGKKDLEFLLENINPDISIPIHGETYFLQKHYDFIKERFPKIQAIKFTNFSTIHLLNNKEVKIEENKIIEPRLIHGNYIEIERTKISERRKIAGNGCVFVSFQIKNENMVVTTLGLPAFASDLEDSLKKLIIHRYHVDLIGRQEDYSKEQIRIMVRQFYNSKLGYKPITIVHFI